MFWTQIRSAALCGAICILSSSGLFGQDAATKAKIEEARAAAQAAAGRPQPTEAKPGQPTPGQPSPAGDSAKPAEAKPAEASGGVVTRPTKPGFDVDPKELDVKPIDGKIQFNFHGQPWQGVLEWLAAISGLSLDWQELPSDHLNLRTQREYSLDEARDLINQHLLARGFTMLRQGEILTVVNLTKLDPALVPHVEPQGLDQRDRHEFVQTTFSLDWIPATTAEEELKPLLSPKGKLTKLTTTNRLHAIDVVANLLAVRDLLSEEQSGRGRERLVRSFKLKHARAEEVKGLLEDFLGVAKKSGPAMPMDPNQMRMMQQQMQQMQQQQQQAGGKPATPGAKEIEISIIANPRDNEIIAQAPPETMAVIEQTVELLDASPNANDSLERQLSRVRVFRLAQLDPETLVTLLNDMGGLSPHTKLTPDKKNNSILVNGSVVDHVVVQQVIERLDSSDRSFEVMRLRRLPADYVAGTIRFMMGGEEEKKQDNSYSRYLYYDPWGSRNQEEEKNTGKFRVDADVENNRLLLWANEIELEEIRNLLVKLGEIRPDEGNRSTVRVLNLSSDQADEFLERLRENWAADETHPLVIEPLKSEIPQGDPFAPETQPAVPPPVEQPAPDNNAKPAVTRASAVPETMLLAWNDELPAPAPEASEAAPDAAISQEQQPRIPAPLRKSIPVKVTRGPDGRLIVTSEDPRALDAVEDLMYELAPPPKDFRIFKLKHPTTYSYYVAWNLEDFFGVDEEGNSDSDYMAGWFGYPRSSSSSSDDAGRLSQRRKLKFIPDEDSRTILVQGATPEQLKTIEELIDLYDQPQSQNSGDMRITRLFKIKHAQAETIATAIKDVYRDLLSSNDRALQSGPNQQGQQQQPVAERSYTYVLGGGGGDKGKETPEAPIKFKGLLSIGIDKESNTLVISASAGIMNDVGELIDSLDIAAKEKEAVSVVRTGGGGIPQNLAGRLKEIFGDKVTIVGEEKQEAISSDEQPKPATVGAR